MKKKMTLILTMLLLVMGLACTAQAAAKKPSVAKKVTVYFNRSQGKLAESYAVVYIKNLEKDWRNKAKITNIKFGNSKVARLVSASSGLDSEKGAGGVGVMLSTRSSQVIGMKSKLTFTVEQNSKKYKLSCIVIFKEEPKVFKSIKICGTECAAKLQQKTPNITLSINDFVKTTGRIRIKTNSKVKLLEISSGSRETYKNGGKITIKRGSFFTITYKYKKWPLNFEPLYDGYDDMFLSNDFYISIQ